LKTPILSSRVFGISLILAVLTLAPNAIFADSLTLSDICNTGSTCPGAPVIGSDSPLTIFAYTITEDDGIPFPLINPITLQPLTVYSGDVLVYEGAILSDLLRFPDNGFGHSQEAILYSSDDSGGGAIPPDRQKLVISIEENPKGDMTLYQALTGSNEVDYTLVSPGDVPAPEPGTATLLGTAGVLLVLGLRFKNT
jgi:hypothetical protein